MHLNSATTLTSNGHHVHSFPEAETYLDSSAVSGEGKLSTGMGDVRTPKGLKMTIDQL